MRNSRNINFANAINEALAVAMARDNSVFLLGEGIDDPAAFFGTTKGLAQQFGDPRALEMPVSENGMVGVAIGAALAGQRPVLSLHRVEFALLAIEQIVNNAAKSHYVSNGKHRVPLVIRLIVGRGWGQGPEHSQSLESVFGHFPGLKVVMPTMPSDAKGMLLAAIEDDNPVIFIEHRWLHATEGHVDETGKSAPLDGPVVLKKGGDVTLVGASQSTLECIRAAEALSHIDVSAEVVDLRVVRPLNVDPIVTSSKKTGYLVTVDSGWRTYGIGAEICSRVTTEAWDSLKAAPIRLGLPDHPTPSSRGMVPGFYPDSIQVVARVGEVLGLAEKMVAKAQNVLAEMVGDQAVDTPSEFFKGPF
ncbi:MAG TPA: alpha-ketoacid dehydrogenase subunit beta [Rhodospirillaceae bacterium]|nr:alpha-ketoacid dehydrogenase subunit beta [Rhodospirillaceae bacterium]HAA93398.1 alpha-ketoacid dehydrogenase subunit beta [Rhodospirillaceae bacterium]HAT34191.1 alpha-ketoacid dehydrogenase subunit beta [Rhodospirillaceae bacterium]